MATAPVVTELPLQNVRFLFGTMVDLRMLPQVLEQTGNAEVGEFKLVAHFPADEKAANNEAGYLARHKGFRGGDYNTYHGDPYTLDEVIWDATGRAGVHLVTKTKYGAVVEFPTIPDKNDSAELMLIVSEYVESIKTPPLIVRCSGFGGSISPLGNKKYQLNLTTGATKCPTSIKDHVPKKYHAEDSEIIPHVGGAYIMNAEDLSPAEQSLISNTIVNQMQGYYRTGVIGTDPVIGAFPNGPMSISKRTPEAKQDFFREPAVQDEDGFWNKGPNRWQAHKIARGVAYNRLERAREMGALTPGYRHRGSSGKFRRNPFIFGAEEMTREEINEAARSVADEWHPAGKAKSCCFCSSTPAYPTQYGAMCEPCANTFGTIVETHFAPGRQNPAGFTPSYNAEDFAAERKLMCAEHDDYFNACGCGSKNAAEETWTEEMICVKCASPFMECQCERCPQCQKFWVDEGPASNCTDCYSCAACCDCHNSGAEDFATERKLMCAEHDDYFNACGCGSKNAEENRQPPWSATNPKPQRKVECGKCDARGYIAGEECDTCDGSGYWMIPSPNCATCDTYLQWDDGAECDDCDAWYCDNHLTEDGGCKVCGNTSLSFHSEDIPVWNDGIVEWETSGPMSPTGSGYSSASVPPTGVMAGPGDTFLNYTDAQNYLVESSGGLWGAEDDEGRHTCDHCGKLADFNFQDIDVRWDLEDGEFTGSYDLRSHLEGYNDFYCITCAEKQGYAAEEEGNTPISDPMEFGEPANWTPLDGTPSLKRRKGAEEETFEAMARIDPKKATDVKNVVSALKKRYNKIKISRTEYITNRKGSSNKYHVFAFTNRGVFNGYGRIGKTMTIFGPMSESQGHSKLDRKLRQGYKETV